MGKNFCPQNIKSSLKTKIWIFITITVAIVVGLASYSTMHVLERQMVRSVEERSNDAEKAILNALEKMMLSKPKNVIKGLKNLLSTLPHKNVSVSIADSSGRIIVSTDTTKIVGEPERLSWLKSGINTSRYLKSQQKVIAIRPIMIREKCRSCHLATQPRLGLLEIAVSTKELNTRLGEIRNLILLNSLAVFIAISLVLGFLLNRLISKPLRILTNSMKEVEKGNLTARSLMHRSDEIGLLSNCFNSMVSRLQDMLKEIEIKYQKELQHADRLSTLGELAAGIAHEIRNPLAAISGAIHVQTMEMESDDPNRKVMEEIQEEITRLDKSLKSFLAYSRPSKPQFALSDLHELIERAITLCIRSGQFSGIKLKKEFAQSLPPMYLDPFLIQQVFVNIIINALQAMDHEGALTIKTEKIEDKFIRITVKDTGHGMPPDIANQIFQPFFSTKAQGTGLGLAIAHRIIEQHHGKISVQSTLGKGTVFLIELPHNFKREA